MDILDHIPVTLDPDKIAARLRFDPVRAGFATLDELVALARSLVRLRAVTETAYIGAKTEGTVEVAGVSFLSRILRRNLDQAHKVFPYVMTIGPELEAAASAAGDILKQYYLDEMANIALEEGAAWLAARLEARSGLTGLANMSPGSLEDWPITEQSKLFSIFGDTEAAVGVRLTDSLFMLPRKSISGIFFPSEEDFMSCRLCDRASCPSRKAAFDPASPPMIAK